jgi:hypothetical protein
VDRAVRIMPVMRIVVGAAAAGLLVLCASVLQTAHHFLQRGIIDVSGHANGRWQSRLFDWVILAGCSETLVAFIVFCALVIVWAIASPHWGRRALNFVGGHVWHTFMLFIAGFALLVGIFALMGPP